LYIIVQLFFVSVSWAMLGAFCITFLPVEEAPFQDVGSNFSRVQAALCLGQIWGPKNRHGMDDISAMLTWHVD
jgi:hypothetical protein